MPISKRDIRRHHRTPCLGPARISWEDEHGFPKYAQARCLEISESGLRIEVFEPIPVRSRVSLRADWIRLQGSATVKHVARHGSKYILGLELSQALRDQALAMSPAKAASELPIENTPGETFRRVAISCWRPDHLPQ